MANNNVASWTAGTILFGGKELHSVSAGSTADATPVGIGGNMVDDAVGDGRYIVFWEKANPSIFQTVLESAYVSDDSRIIVMELTGSATGGDVQIQSRDASHGASDKLNADSFNKIVAGEFATGPLVGDSAQGVLFNSTGLYTYEANGSTIATKIGSDGMTLYGSTGTFAPSDNYITFNSGQPGGSSDPQGVIGLYTPNGGTDYFVSMSSHTYGGIYISSYNRGGTVSQSSIYLDARTASGYVQVMGTNADQGFSRGSSSVFDVWTFPQSVAASGQVLTVSGTPGGSSNGTTNAPRTTTLTWTDKTDTTLNSSSLASGSVPTSAYGTFKYALDGNGASVPTLGFASGQTNATPAAATAQSAFWSMLSESDGSTGSNLIFEPIVDYDSTDTTKNRAFIGYHNPLFATYSYYLNGGSGTAAFPSHSFYGDVNTGMYLNSADNIAFSTGGTARIQIYSGGLYPSYDDTYDLGHASFRWDDVYATNGTIQTSDVRLKELITPITLGLDFVNDLNPVSYKWKKKKEDKVDQTHYGIIAQEVMETLEKYGISSVEEFGGITYEGGEEDYYGARYTEFIPMLIKAVQELSDEVKELKEKL